MASENSFTPVRIDTSGAPVEQKVIPLFYLGETEYTGPEHVSARTALTALEVAAEKGNAAAAYHCLIECIGQDAYRALVDCPQLTFAQAQEILTNITAMYFGQATSVAGK